MGKYSFTIFMAALLLNLCPIKGLASPLGNRISGRVVDQKTQTALIGAAVVVDGTYLWAVADEDGQFTINGIPDGEITLRVSYLGYVNRQFKMILKESIDGLVVQMNESTLALDEVVVTAQTHAENPNTTLTIGSEALKHMQVSNVSDISALLPGGKMVNPDLTVDNKFLIRGSGSTAGNAEFGVAVEVDGVRMSNNSSLSALDGVSTRNIAVANVDHIEVMMGVPSAEYGDLNSGLIKVHTRKGQSPLQVLTAINPRTWQLSASRGFDLGKERGLLNLSAEWSKTTKSLTSPYYTYTRRGFSASYSNTFLKVLKFELNAAANIGGLDSKDDPDAYSGEYTKVKDNVFRANTSLTWLINKPWITNLKFDASIFFNDNRSHEHAYHSSASEQPAVHATTEGYYLADKLPYTYFSDQIIDSKELDYAASLKYEWTRRFGYIRHNLKGGVQWKATGNVGDGEYYADPSLSPHQYRPRPYSEYPYMHNMAIYAEEKLAFPIATTTMEVTAGLRYERLFIKGTSYNNLNTLSPRFNARWRLMDGLSLRGGWGVTEKLPSFYVLYPDQQYQDIQTFGFSYNNNETSYVYYTRPYTLNHNADLKWQRNYNSEIGIDLKLGAFDVSLVGYYNVTKRPYKYSYSYTPFSYQVLQLPSGYTVPTNPQIRVDEQTGDVFLRANDGDYWTQMDTKVVDQTFVSSVTSDNGANVTRKGMELIVDFPEIRSIRTKFRMDAAYTYSKYIDNSLSTYYQSGWSHTSLSNRSYQYVGIYANGGGTSTSNGRRTRNVDANLTAITHIPDVRLIISCRLEMSLLNHYRNLSEYNGKEYAFNVGQDDYIPSGGSIYGAESYTAIYPVAYMDLSGNVHPFTEAEAADTQFSNLILKSGNGYTYSSNGYKPYYSLNINITKEIGDHVSVSFFANNILNKRYITSRAMRVEGSFPTKFYYGITGRIKL